MGMAKDTGVGSLDLNVEGAVGFVGFTASMLCCEAFYLLIPTLLLLDGRAGGFEAFGTLAVLGPHTLRFLVSVAAGMTLGALVVYLFGPRAAKRDNGGFMAFAFLGALCLALLLFPLPLPELARMGFAAASGFGLVCAVALWFACLQMQKPLANAFMTFLGVAASVGVCVGLCFMPSTVVRVVIGVAGIIGAACLIAYAKVSPRLAQVPDTVPNEVVRERMKIERSQDVMLAFTFFELGLAAGVALSLNAVPVVLAGALAVAVVLAVDAAGANKVTERRTHALTVPFTTAALCLLFFFDNVVTCCVALTLLAVVTTLYSLLAWRAMAEHVRISRLAPLRIFGRSRILDYPSLALGIVAGGFAGVLLSLDSLYALRFGVVLAVLYGFLAALFHRSRFPETYMEKEQHNEAAGLGKGMWRKRCRVLADDAGLSERQFEVLILLAQGRNARSIADVLTISYSTARTHIRNIYMKVGVHSTQELLDAVENTKLYGED